MVAFAALIAGFILIALVVITTAFTGRRGARRRAVGESNSGVFVGVGIVTLVVGLGLPAVLLVANADNAKTRAAGGVNLSADAVKGRQLFAHNCATCHTLKASNSVGKIGPNLDVLRPPKALVTNAIKLGRAQGNGNMPAALLTGRDAQNVAAYIASVAGQAEGVQTDLGTGSSS